MRRSTVLAREEYYSIGGGFIVQAGAEADAGAARAAPPYEFDSGARLLELGRAQGLEIHELMLARERTWRSDAEIRAGSCASGRSCRIACAAASKRRACCPACWACAAARRSCIAS